MTVRLVVNYNGMKINTVREYVSFFGIECWIVDTYNVGHHFFKQRAYHIYIFFLFIRIYHLKSCIVLCKSQSQIVNYIG